MPAQDALHLRTLLTEQVQRPGFHRMLSDYIDYQREHKTWGNQELTVAANKPRWDGQAFARALRVSETFYVSPDMVALALRAMQDFPDEEIILREDAPAEAGLMLLGQPFRQMDLQGRALRIHGCLWAGTRIWTLTDQLDDEDDLTVESQQRYGDMFKRVVGRYDVGSMIQFKWGESMPKSMRLRNAILGPDDKMIRSTGPDGQTFVASDHVVDLWNGPPVYEAADGFMQLLLATWRLMQQTLAEVHREEPDRPARKRALRVGIKDTGVTVISLRRRESHGRDLGGTLDYRTIVRGHWRRVWCGPKDKPEERYQRAVYIHPFWRGPEGAPIIIRQRVNALVR